MSLEETYSGIEAPCYFCEHIVPEEEMVWSQHPYIPFCSEKCYDKWEDKIYKKYNKIVEKLHKREKREKEQAVDACFTAHSKHCLCL